MMAMPPDEKCERCGRVIHGRNQVANLYDGRIVCNRCLGELPTDEQMAYAESLGITKPAGCSRGDLSILIYVCLEKRRAQELEDL
jgi:hypothetical protein